MRKRGIALLQAQDDPSPDRGPGQAGSGPTEVSAAVERPPLPEFAPVPRKYRHDGWTPERQRGFVEAPADTGCVSRAASMVNMAQANCYTLRRAAGAAGVSRETLYKAFAENLMVQSRLRPRRA